MSSFKQTRRHVADVIYEAASKATLSRAVGSRLENLPALSLYAFVTSLMALGSRVMKIGRLELGLAEIISWKRPEMTITILIFYSQLCYHPQWIILTPLFYFVGFMLVPNYAQKFKLDTSLADLNQTSVILGKPVSNDEQVKHDKSLLKAVRQGQKTLTDIVDALDKFDNFRNGPAQFEDPQLSCLMLIAATAILAVAGYSLTFVSIPAVFTTIGWILVFSKHPIIEIGKKKLDHKYSSSPSRSKRDYNEVLAKVREFGQRNILLDDEVLIRKVEIYELQPQGLTARQWKDEETVFSTKPYEFSSPERANHRPPHGVRDISDVLPPTNWYFELSDEWEVDSDPNVWASEHKLSQLPTDGCWVYDDGGSTDDTSNWRRRRLTRKCYYDFK